VIVLRPETRKVKTECDRDERWFINVEATERLDCARVSSEATREGPDRGTAYEGSDVSKGYQTGKGHTYW
jgi:hypothetical protein